jgi:hypothetical protein
MEPFSCRLEGTNSRISVSFEIVGEIHSQLEGRPLDLLFHSLLTQVEPMVSESLQMPASPEIDMDMPSPFAETVEFHNLRITDE